KRLARRFGRRDRAVIGAAALAGVLGTAGFVATGSARTQRTDAQCLRYSEAGVMGGGSWLLCGADAIAFCSSRDRTTASLAQQCANVRGRARARRQALRTPPPTG